MSERYNCDACNDTGITDTGTNDLPCESCAKGKTALFNTGLSGYLTGEQVLRGYNPPANLRKPPSWYPKQEQTCACQGCLARSQVVMLRMAIEKFLELNRQSGVLQSELDSIIHGWTDVDVERPDIPDRAAREEFDHKQQEMWNLQGEASDCLMSALTTTLPKGI